MKPENRHQRVNRLAKEIRALKLRAAPPKAFKVNPYLPPKKLDTAAKLLAQYRRLSPPEQRRFDRLLASLRSEG